MGDAVGAGARATGHAEAGVRLHRARATGHAEAGVRLHRARATGHAEAGVRLRVPGAALVLAVLVVTLLAGPPARGAEDGAPDDAGWTSPVPGDLVVVRGFLPPDRDWLAGHRGVDLEAQPGSAVVAPEDGMVTFAGTVVDRGVLVVLHDGGLRSSLEPVDGSVAVGTRVGRGQVVGTVEVGEVGGSAGTGPAGAGHCLPASCLHWGVRRGDTYVDPLALLGPREPIVLLPLR
ncbi:murein hydrolase activator EnvC family protein [Oerskovia sp. NPDC057915]|uniref:murein hydrolase activator EnvC family protein n=1 Tax=Oerskovia sp. NPDC057915 TaxID=3346280 RepID=UPI0036DD4F60